MSEVSAAPAASKRARPLSPHLQVYKPQITSVMSIFHRITGVGLSFGTLLLVCWLVAAATGEAAYNNVQAFMGSPIGIILLMGWSWALMYHLCTGIRHLVWDMGKALSLPAVYATGYAALAISTLLTVVIWLAAWSKLS